MSSLAGMNPPREVLELGTPDKVYRPMAVTRGMVLFTYIGGTVALLLGIGMIVLKDFLGLIPAEAGSTVYVMAAIFIGGALFMFIGLTSMQNSKPKYLYAFYPAGLVMYLKGEWGMIPWRNVTALDERGEPMLVLHNRTMLPVVTDLQHRFAVLEDLRRYVAAKDELIEAPRPAVTAATTFGRSAPLQLLAGLALLAASGVTTYLTWDWMQNLFKGPRVMTHDELVQLEDPTSLWRGWVSIDVPEVIKTDVEFVKSRLGLQATQSKVVLIKVKDRYLIANVPINFEPGKGVRGVVEVWRGDGGRYTRVQSQAADEVAKAFPQYRDKLLPFQFDGTVHMEGNAYALPLALGVAALVGLGCLLTGWARLRQKRPKVTV
jgi:hypothetical protein